jgi:hypothetical protein
MKERNLLVAMCATRDLLIVEACSLIPHLFMKKIGQVLNVQFVRISTKIKAILKHISEKFMKESNPTSVLNAM